MKVIGLIVIAAFVPGFAHALSIQEVSKEFSKVIPFPSHKIGSIKKSTAASLPDKCTDFSGTWEGTCKDGAGNTTAASVKITQVACTGFKEGLPDLIGKIESGETNDGKAVDSTWLTLDWDKDGRNLYWVYGVSGREIGKSSAYSATVLRAVAIENGNLIFQSNGLISGLQEGQPGQGEIKDSCTFKKK